MKSFEGYHRTNRRCGDFAVHMPHPHSTWDPKFNRNRHHWCPGVPLPTLLVNIPPIGDLVAKSITIRDQLP